jgi:hypothetical protein
VRCCAYNALNKIFPAKKEGKTVAELLPECKINSTPQMKQGEEANGVFV